MEKINEKRLSVLKVALELLKEVQERQEIDIEPINIEINSTENVKELAVGELICSGQTIIDSISYTINHLGRSFESTDL